MELTAILSIVSVFLVLFAAKAHQGRKEAQEGRHNLYEELDAAKGKLEAVRQDLGKAKESLTKKTKALEEMRAQAKKKERRESKAQNRKRQEEQLAQEPQDNSMAQEEIKKLKKSLAAMEHQVVTLQKEVDISNADAQQNAEAHWGKQLDQLKEALSAAEAKANDAQETLSRFRKETEEEKNRKQKYPTPLDLDSLDKDVVNELARYFKKSSHYERLYNVAQGQVKMAQDKALDLQRRYREVCRELAIVAGSQQKGAPTNAVETAEAIVQAVATDEKHDARFGEAGQNSNIDLAQKESKVKEDSAATSA